MPTAGSTITYSVYQAIQLDFQGANDVFLALPKLAKRTSLHLMWSKVHHPMLLYVDSDDIVHRLLISTVVSPCEMKSKANVNAKPASVTWVDGPHLVGHLLQSLKRKLADLFV